MQCQQYDFKIIHRKGSMMQAPDALSRNPEGIQELEHIEISLITFQETQDEWYSSLKKKVQENPIAYEKFAVKDDLLFKLISTGPNEPLKWVQLLPAEKRKEALCQAHDVPTSGHGGFFRTFNRLRQTCYWPGMKTAVKNYVERCHTCLSTKKDRRRPPGLMGSQRIVSEPTEVVSTDLVGPLPRSKSGHTYLSVITDAFSKYVWLRPLRVGKAKNVCKHLREDLFLRHGAPRLILCDNGSQYQKEFQQLCEEFHTKIRYNIPYNPRANPTERYNQTVETIICSYVKDHRDWDKFIPEIQAAMNSSVSHVTGHTPHFVVFNTELVLDGRERRYDGKDEEIITADPEEDTEEEAERRNLMQGIRSRLKEAHNRNSQRYNLRRREYFLNPDDMVMKKNFVKSNKAKGISKKLAQRWVGPYKVKIKLGRVSYMLEDEKGKEEGPWHIDQLKKIPS